MTHEAYAESPNLGEAPFVTPSPDWKQFAGNDQGRIIFVDASTCKIVRTLKTKYSNSASVFWTPNGEKLVIFFVGGGGAVIDQKNGRELGKLPDDYGSTGRVHIMSRDGNLLVGNRRGHLGVWNLANLGFTDLVPAGGAATALSPDGAELCLGAIAEGRFALRLFDWATLKLKREIPLTLRPLETLYLRDGTHIWVSDNKGQIQLIDKQTGAAEPQLTLPEAPFRTSISNDGSLISFVVRKRAAGLIDYRDGKLSLRRWYPEANAAFILPDKSRFVTYYGNLKLYDPNQPDVVRTTSLGPGPWNIRFRRVEGKDYITSTVPASATNSLSLHEVVDGSPVLRGSLNLPKGLGGLDRKSFTVLVFQEGRVIVTDLRSAKELLSLDQVGAHRAVCRFGDRLAVTLDGFKVEVYSLKSRAREASFTVKNRIQSFYADDQGNRLAIVSDSGQIEMLDTASWKPLWSVMAHAQQVLEQKFSRDGKLFITCGHDDVARLWDAATGTKLQTFEGHAQSVTNCDVTPDGTRAVTVSDDQTVRVWDTKTGLELTTLGIVGPFPTVCSVTVDGKFVVTAGNNGDIKLWPISPR
jgi:WD40 repeat protein